MNISIDNPCTPEMSICDYTTMKRVSVSQAWLTSAVFVLSLLAVNTLFFCEMFLYIWFHFYNSAFIPMFPTLVKWVLIITSDSRKGNFYVLSIFQI